jgi:hypothetical protein
VTPKRTRSMVDGLRRKSSLRDELARKTSTDDGTTTSRRPRSFVETSSTSSLQQRTWFQKSKSQVQMMVMGSFMSDIHLSLEVEKKPSQLPQRRAHTLTRTPRSMMKTPPSPTASSSSRRSITEHSSVEDDQSRSIAEVKQDSFGKQLMHRRNGSSTKTQNTVVASQQKSLRKSSKTVTTVGLKNEMDVLIHGGSKGFRAYNNDDDQGENNMSMNDSAPRDNSRSLRQLPRVKSALHRIQSIAKSESSGSASSQYGRNGYNSDEDLSESALARRSTPTISNLRKTVLSSHASHRTKEKKIQSKPVGKSSASDESSVSDDASASSSSQSQSRIVRRSPLLKTSRSGVSVDMAGFVQSYPASPKNLPLPESPAVVATSPAILRRLNKSVVGKDDRKRPKDHEPSPDIPLIFDEEFYSSSHVRRVLATRSLIWTTDRQDNFSDWILLIIRTGVSWETSNVDTYHIHKSVVGVGPRPSLFLLDQFAAQDSVYVRNTSSVEMFSQAADLVPTMLDYIYGMRGEPLHITTTTATGLRYLADKFGVESMFQEVNEFIQRDLNESTVDTYNNDAVLFKDKKLMQAAIRLQKALQSYEV